MSSRPGSGKENGFKSESGQERTSRIHFRGVRLAQESGRPRMRAWEWRIKVRNPAKPVVVESSFRPVQFSSIILWASGVIEGFGARFISVQEIH